MNLKDVSDFDQFCIVKKFELKVCGTCAGFSLEGKGTCYRDGKAVGKFWYCKDWVTNEPEE